MDNLLYYIGNDQFWVGLFIGVLTILFLSLFAPHLFRVLSRKCSVCDHTVLKRPRRVFRIKDRPGWYGNFIFKNCERCHHISGISYDRPMSNYRIWWISFWEPEVFRYGDDEKKLFRNAGLVLPSNFEVIQPIARQPRFVAKLASVCHALSW